MDLNSYYFQLIYKLFIRNYNSGYSGRQTLSISIHPHESLLSPISSLTLSQSPFARCIPPAPEEVPHRFQSVPCKSTLIKNSAWITLHAIILCYCCLALPYASHPPHSTFFDPWLSSSSRCCRCCCSATQFDAVKATKSIFLIKIKI